MSTPKQRWNGILIYSRHSTACPHAGDSGYVKCQCPLWLQWQENGKPLQKSAKTRSITQAREEAEKQDRINRGEAPSSAAESKLTVEAGIKVWLTDRTARKRGNEKAARMGGVLVEWLKNRNPPIL